MRTLKMITGVAIVLKDTLLHKREAMYVYEASRLLKEAMDEADEEHRKDRWRYYVIWDETRDQLISITYEIHRGRWNSYQYLRQRGRFKEYMPHKHLKELSFYYTPSRWCAGCSPEERIDKMKEFQQFYVRRKMKNGSCHKLDNLKEKKRKNLIDNE